MKVSRRKILGGIFAAGLGYAGLKMTGIDPIGDLIFDKPLKSDDELVETFSKLPKGVQREAVDKMHKEFDKASGLEPTLDEIIDKTKDSHITLEELSALAKDDKYFKGFYDLIKKDKNIAYDVIVDKITIPDEPFTEFLILLLARTSRKGTLAKGGLQKIQIDGWPDADFYRFVSKNSKKMFATVENSEGVSNFFDLGIEDEKRKEISERFSIPENQITDRYIELNSELNKKELIVIASSNMITQRCEYKNNELVWHSEEFNFQNNKFTEDEYKAMTFLMECAYCIFIEEPNVDIAVSEFAAPKSRVEVCDSLSAYLKSVQNPSDGMFIKKGRDFLAERSLKLGQAKSVIYDVLEEYGSLEYKLK